VIIIRVLVFAAGAALIVLTVLSAVRTFVLPRAVASVMNRFLFRFVRHVFFLPRVKKANTYEQRDAIMAMYAPIALLSLPPMWLTLVALGYAAMFWALGGLSWREALTLSGSSLLTLGFAVPASLAGAVLAFSEAFVGLILVALLIAYLPTIYAAFSRREEAVSLLEVRAGSPPSAVELILRYHRIHGLDRLNELWAAWEAWFAELEESHTSLASLVFFRSPHPNHSWVTAAGAVLDAAALSASTLDLPRAVQSNLTIRAGYLALRAIADFFRLHYNPEPRPEDPISISRYEFDEAYSLMQARGVPLVADRDKAWRDFAGWRVNYDAVLLALADLTMAPYATWSSDRSARRARQGSIWQRANSSRQNFSLIDGTNLPGGFSLRQPQAESAAEAGNGADVPNEASPDPG
jgi:hypothetical protein